MSNGDKTSEFLHKLLKWLIFASVLVPLIIFKNYVSPFHFGKVIIFRSLVEIMLAVYLLLIWRNKTYFPKFSKITWSFLAFALAFSITTATSIIPYASFWGTLERMGGLFTFWHYFIFFIILTSIFRTEKEWLSLLNVVVGVGILSAFYGFLQKTDAEFIVGSGGRSRIFGTIGNAALFGGYQLFIFFISVMLYFRPSANLNEKMLYVAGALFTGLAVLMTAVRGSILALGVGILVFALVYTAAYRSKKGKKALLGLVGLLIAFIAFALMFKNTDFVQDSGYLRRITDFSLTNYTVQTRFWAWEAGFKGWSEDIRRITLGWGPENFNIPFSKYFNPKFYQGIGSETLFDRAHNQFVEVLVTMGLLGFLAYLSIYFYAFKAAWQKIKESNHKHYGVGLIAILVAYMIHNFFIFDTSANFYIFFTVLGFIFFLQKGEAKPVLKDAKKAAGFNRNIWGVSAFALVVLVILSIYKFNILPARANYATTRAIIMSWDGNFVGAVEKYKEALSYNVPGKYEFRNRYAQYVLEYTTGRENTPETIDALQFGIEELEKNVNENEPDYLPLLYLSRLYIHLGKGGANPEYNDIALTYSTKAKDLAPDFVRTYYELGQAYLNKKDYDKAIENFKHAAELNPDVGLSYWYWGVVEIERGNEDEGLAIIEKAINSGSYTPIESDINKLITLYVRRQEFAKIEPLLITLTTQVAPQNPQYHASLATLYAQFGRIPDAVKAAKEAARLDPTFEPDARAFVQQIGGTW